MKRLFAMFILISLVGFEIPHTVDIPDGAYGAWQCPALGTSSLLYEGNSTEWQSIVDEDNSALWMNYNGIHVIADHAGSEVGGGIWNVNDMSVGGLAFLIEKEATYEYRCYLIAEADHDGYCWKINNQPIRPYRATDIMCESCAAEDGKVYVAFYSYVGELP